MKSGSTNATRSRFASMPEPTPPPNGSSMITINADGSFYCSIPDFLGQSLSPSDDLDEEYRDHGRLSRNGTADDALQDIPLHDIEEELSDLASTDGVSINRSVKTTNMHLSGATATEDTDTGPVSFNPFEPNLPRPQLPHADFSISVDRNYAGYSVSPRIFFYPQNDPFPVHKIALLAHLQAHLRASMANPQSGPPVPAVLAQVQYHVALVEPKHGMRLPAHFGRPALYMHSECMACTLWHPKEVSRMLNLCTFIREAMVEEAILVDVVLEEVLAMVENAGWLDAWGGGNGADRLQDVAQGAKVGERGGTLALKRVNSAREAAAEMAVKLEKQGVLKPTPSANEVVGRRIRANGTRKLTKERKPKEAREEVEGSEDWCKLCSALKKLFK